MCIRDRAPAEEPQGAIVPHAHGGAENPARQIWRGSGAVSYTHLDVYKRQVKVSALHAAGFMTIDDISGVRNHLKPC